MNLNRRELFGIFVAAALGRQVQSKEADLEVIDEIANRLGRQAALAIDKMMFEVLHP